MYVVRMWFVDLADLRMRLKMLLLLLLERSGERTAEDAGGFSSLERTNERTPNKNANFFFAKDSRFLTGEKEKRLQVDLSKEGDGSVQRSWRRL